MRLRKIKNIRVEALAVREISIYAYIVLGCFVVWTHDYRKVEVLCFITKFAEFVELRTTIIIQIVTKNSFQDKYTNSFYKEKNTSSRLRFEAKLRSKWLLIAKSPQSYDNPKV